MIEDSYFWRKDLTRFAASLERARRESPKTSAAWARLERDHMYGFFALRRLTECFKLSDDTLEVRIPVTQYRFRANSYITLLNWSQLERHYQLDRPFKSHLSVRELANQIIHSYVFSFVADSQGRLRGVVVSSEFRRRRSIAYLSAWRTVRLFRRVAADWPDVIHYTQDLEKGDLRYSAGRTKAR